MTRCERPDCDHSHDARTMTNINGVWVCSEAVCVDWGFSLIGDIGRSLKALMRTMS